MGSTDLFGTGCPHRRNRDPPRGGGPGTRRGAGPRGKTNARRVIAKSDDVHVPPDASSATYLERGRGAEIVRKTTAARAHSREGHQGSAISALVSAGSRRERVSLSFCQRSSCPSTSSEGRIEAPTATPERRRQNGRPAAKDLQPGLSRPVKLRGGVEAAYSGERAYEVRSKTLKTECDEVREFPDASHA